MVVLYLRHRGITGRATPRTSGERVALERKVTKCLGEHSTGDACLADAVPGSSEDSFPEGNSFRSQMVVSARERKPVGVELILSPFSTTVDINVGGC